jgi:NitT/TauT family transport system substrate-binding protein
MRLVRKLAFAVVCVLVLLAVVGGPASGAPDKATLTTITVDTLPIANARPLDLGIAKGFFSSRGIEIKKSTLQSGNDIVLALANHNGDIGYLGYVPMMIARTQAIPLTLIAASEVEGTSTADNWQNILVKGNSSIQTPADLAGKTIAVNALKGVGEVIIKAALKKVGVDPNSIKLLALPFPSMRSALSNGQVDAIWTPEPFLTQALSIDGARIVMAPGPVLGNFYPNRGLRGPERLDQVEPDARQGLQGGDG